MSRKSLSNRCAATIAVALACFAAIARAASAADGLSDAAKETRKTPSDQNVLVAKAPKPEAASCDGGFDWVGLLFSGGDDGDRPHRHHHRSPYLPVFHLGLVGGSIAAGGGNFEAGSGFGGLQIGGAWPRARVDLDLLGWGQRFTAASGVRGAFDHPLGLGLDLSARYLPTRRGRVLGVAPMVGFRVENLSWSYHNGVFVDDGWGVHRADDDALPAYSPYAGVAVTLLDSPHFQLAGIVKSGARFYGRYTDQGLRNDMFRTSGFVQVGLESTFPF